MNKSYMLAIVSYSEILRPPLWLLAFIYFLLLSMVVAIWAAFDNRATLISFVAATLLMPWIYILLRSEVSIRDGELRIDSAHIPLRYLENTEVLTGSQMRFLRTQGADPAAYLAIRFWLSSGIKVEVNDQRDPTPYWLISTKNAVALADAIQA